MASLLTKSLHEDERDALLHQLSQIDSAGLELVNTIINMNPSNEDGLLLVLGALARNSNPEIQSKVVNELFRRLDIAKSIGNSSNHVATINYALGNTGSRLAIDGLLPSLSHNDLDTQISAIRSLDVHLDQPIVQQALITLTKTTMEDKVLEEVLTILKNAFNSKVLRHPSKDMLSAMVNATIRVENPNLYVSLVRYLLLVGTDEALRNIDTIMQKHEFNHSNMSSVEGNSRIKRTSQWDTTNSYYNPVASYYDRRNDVLNYPIYKSHLASKSYGVSKLYLAVRTGTFIGSQYSSTTKRMKVFDKVIEEVRVLGGTHHVATLEYYDYTTSSNLYHKEFVKLGSSVRKNYFKKYDLSCRKFTGKLWDTSLTILKLNLPFFIYVGTLNLYITGTALTRGDAGVCICPLELKACEYFKPSTSLRVSGGGYANLLVSVTIYCVFIKYYTYTHTP